MCSKSFGDSKAMAKPKKSSLPLSLSYPIKYIIYAWGLSG